jgi:hypothetical protein
VQVSKAMAQANYYESQVAQAKSDTDMFKQRAERAAGASPNQPRNMDREFHV